MIESHCQSLTFRAAFAGDQARQARAARSQFDDRLAFESCTVRRDVLCLKWGTTSLLLNNQKRAVEEQRSWYSYAKCLSSMPPVTKTGSPNTRPPATRAGRAARPESNCLLLMFRALALCNLPFNLWWCAPAANAISAAPCVGK